MLKRLYNGSIYRIKGIWGSINRLFYKEPYIIDTINGLNSIKMESSSVSRFGDGEFNIIMGKSLGFQKYDSLLAQRLLDVLQSDNSNLKVAIPDVFGSLKEYRDKPAAFWRAYLGVNRGKIISMLDLKRTYYNTNMTRFWSGYKTSEKTEDIIRAYKKIWANKNVIFIEGKLTRMGVGNDLFDNVKSIRRILCPAKDAWFKYSEILETIKNNRCDDALYIIALGPTATVLAYDLCNMGLQALDLGHIDVQYEYYKRKAKEKIALEGKYVNENENGNIVSDSIIDENYINSILSCIE